MPDKETPASLRAIATAALQRANNHLEAVRALEWLANVDQSSTDNQRAIAKISIGMLEKKVSTEVDEFIRAWQEYRSQIEA